MCCWVNNEALQSTVFTQALNPPQAYHSAAARLLLFQNASYVTPYNVTVSQVTQVLSADPAC